jgi:hypothetical protein
MDRRNTCTERRLLRVESAQILQIWVPLYVQTYWSINEVACDLEGPFIYNLPDWIRACADVVLRIPMQVSGYFFLSVTP